MHMMGKPEITPEYLSAVAREAKAIVALAFRNGPIENFHAEVCPTCDGNSEYSRITPDEMRSIMKNAVDHMYTYLLLEGERQTCVRCAPDSGREIHEGVG
jgi:hypothetical protein